MIRKEYKNSILYIDDELRIEYKRGKIIFVSKNDIRIKSLCIAGSILNKFLSKFRILERLFRLEPRRMVIIGNDKFLVSYNGQLYFVDISSAKMQPLFSYNHGTKNPLYFDSYNRNNKTEVVFGDYGGYDSEYQVGVFRYADGKVTPIAGFDHHEVDHIHNVLYDAKRDMYWIFTGDSNQGTGIWTLDYEGGTPQAFLVGSQQYRACFGYVRNNRLWYVTDSPNEANHMYSVDIETKEVRVIAEIAGPCIYGTKLLNGMFCFATSVEPNPALPNWRYRISYQLGKGVTDRYTHIYLCDDEERVIEVWRAKKDALPMWIFQFGNTRFPIQKVMDKVYFCPQCCSGKKGTYSMELGTQEV